MTDPHAAHAGQARPDHGHRQRPLARLGDRQGGCMRRVPSWRSPTRARRCSSACGRWPSSSAPSWSCRPTSPTPRASTPCSRDLAPAWGRLDFLVHAIAFSDKEELKGRYIDTSLDNFQRTMLISCFSFTDLARRAEPLMTAGRQPADADLHRRREGDAALQRHGRRQGGAGGLRPLPRGRPRRRRHPGQRDLGRPGAHARRLRHRRLPLHPEVERVQRAAQAQHDDRGCRRCRASTCCPTSAPAPPARCCTSIRGYHVVGMKAVDAPDISVV